jgi:hypothetical protein
MKNPKLKLDPLVLSFAQLADLSGIIATFSPIDWIEFEYIHIESGAYYGKTFWGRDT